MEDTFKPGRVCKNQGATAAPQTTKKRTSRAQQRYRNSGPRSELADSIARRRGQDVIVILRRTGPPYDYKTLRGYASRP
jgi:hypothetical protein